MNLMFSAGAIVGDELYFSAFYTNALFSYNFVSEELKFVSFFPGISRPSGELHKKAIYYNGKIFFVPDADSGVVHVYDCNTKDLLNITISIDSASKYRFSDGFIVDNKLWILPGNREERITTIDLITLKEERLISFDKYIKGEGGNQVFLNNAYLDGKFYMPVTMSGKLVVYDILSGRVDVVETGYDALISAYNIKNQILITTRKSELISYSQEGIKKQNIINPVCNNGIGEYHVCEGIDDQLFLLPVFGGKVSVGKLNSGEFQDFVLHDYANKEKKTAAVKVLSCGNFSAFSEKLGVSLVMTADGLLMINTKGYRIISLRYKDDNIELLKNPIIYHEGVTGNLRGFIDDIIL